MGMERPPWEEPCVLDERLFALREDLIGELMAINQYQRHAMETDDPELRQLFCHTMNDEKHHVAEFMHAICQIDPVQRRFCREMMGQMPDMPGMPPGRPPYGYAVDKENNGKA
ncbi:MAG TPA: hypothetical protein GXX69_01455 [Firmicutes bacterium]|jgi:rubrerythrin|nr:hypothetical protein [Bacillota bacterium]